METQQRVRPSVASTEASRAIAADAEVAQLDESELLERIERLRRDRGAIILAHNYQIPVIQDLADFVGDSLQLSQEAAQTDASLIVFCGVHFMAETAAMLSPQKTVLIPDPEAGCSLAASVTPEDVRRWRAEYPGAVVVSYVNTDAAVKAESDYCCTSSNAVKIVESIPEDRQIIFLPDMFLGAYIQSKTGRKLVLWMGECHVHAGIRPEDIQAMMERHADADLLLHPECGCVSQCMFALAEGDLGRPDPHPEHRGHGAARPQLPRRRGSGRNGGRPPLPPPQGEPGEAVHSGARGRDLRVHEDDHAARASTISAKRSACTGRSGDPRPIGGSAGCAFAVGDGRVVGQVGKAGRSRNRSSWVRNASVPSS